MALNFSYSDGEMSCNIKYNQNPITLTHQRLLLVYQYIKDTHALLPIKEVSFQRLNLPNWEYKVKYQDNRTWKQILTFLDPYNPYLNYSHIQDTFQINEISPWVTRLRAALISAHIEHDIEHLKVIYN